MRQKSMGTKDDFVKTCCLTGLMPEWTGKKMFFVEREK